jgi:hypothetical protein
LTVITDQNAKRSVSGEWLASAGLLGVVLVIGLATVHDIGITIDEFLFDGYGPMALAWYLSLGADRALTDHFGTWFYGPWFQIVTAVAQSFHAADDFDVRHALSFVVGLSGLAAVVPIGRMAIGPWAGFVALALCLLTGNLYGHLFFTPNDVPFMAVMTWALLAIIAMARGGTPSWRATLTAGACCGLAIATRIGGILAQVYLVAAMSLLCIEIIALRGRAGFTSIVQTAVRTASALAIGWLAAILLWPYLQAANPLERFLSAYRHFGEIKLEMVAPLWGQGVSTNMLPWYYIPGELAARLPEIFIVLLLAALGFGIVATAALFRRLPHGLVSVIVQLAGARALLLIMAAALAPMLFIIATGSTLYDGIRHILFTLPPLALIAAWAMLKLAPMIRRFPIPFATLAAAQVISAVFIMVKLHPLEYIATNAFAGWTAGSYGRFELDYWTVAATPALRRLEMRIAQERGAPDEPLRLFICIPWREHMVAPMFRRAWRIADNPQTADFIIETERYHCAKDAGGKLIDEVIRFGKPFAWTYRMSNMGNPR